MGESGRGDGVTVRHLGLVQGSTAQPGGQDD